MRVKKEILGFILLIVFGLLSIILILMMPPVSQNIDYHDFSCHNKYDDLVAYPYFGAYQYDRHAKSLGGDQLDGAKNISLQCDVPDCSRSILGKFNRNWFATHSKIF